MDYNEFLEMFAQAVENGDINIEFNKGLDDYDSPCIKCKLNAGYCVSSESVVLGFQFPE